MATLDQSYTTGATQINFGYSSRAYLGQLVTISNAGTLDNVHLWLQKVSTPIGNMTCTIYSDTGTDHPNAAISDSQNLDVSTLSGAAMTECTFTFSTKPTITVGQKVWIVIYYNGDGTKYLLLNAGDSTGYNGKVNYSANSPVSWGLFGGGGYDLNFKQYYNPPSTGNNTFRSLMGVGK